MKAAKYRAAAAASAIGHAGAAGCPIAVGRCRDKVPILREVSQGHRTGVI